MYWIENPLTFDNGHCFKLVYEYSRIGVKKYRYLHRQVHATDRLAAVDASLSDHTR